MKKIFLLGIFCGIPLLNAEPFSPGGVAVDWSLYDPKPQAPATRINLMKNGSFEEPGTDLQSWLSKGSWVGWAHIHTLSATPEIKAFQLKLKQVASRSVRNDCAAEGKFSACLITPEEVKNMITPLPMISNKIQQTIRIPAAEMSRRYRLTFSLRGRHIPTKSLTSAIIRMEGFKTGPDGRLAKSGKAVQTGYKLRPEWTQYKSDIVLAPGASAIKVTVNLYGLGELRVDNLRLFPAETEQNEADRVQVRLSPYALLDNTWCIGEGLPGVLCFAFHADNKNFPRKALKLELTLPEGFRAVDCRDLCRLSGGSGNVWQLDLMGMSRVTFQDWYMLQAASVMVESTLPSSEKLYTGRYRLIDGDWKGRSHEFKLKVIPAFYGVRPKVFRSAAMLGNEFTFKGPGRKKIADFYLKSGFSCIHGAAADLAGRMKEAGIPRYCEAYYLSNGFRLGAAPKPEFAQFKTADGKPYPRKICPVEVYTRGSYYMKEVYGKILKKAIVDDDVTDFFMPNWEPYYLDSKGCFCNRCRDEFIRYSKGKPSKEEIMAVWPGSLLRKYAEEYFKFRSWQHGQLVITLHKDVAALGKSKGRESAFIPEISWNSVTYEGSTYSRQYNVRDYMYELPWLEPWGPYVYNRAGQPYNYYPTAHLPVYVLAGMMRQFIFDHFKGKKTPGMIAFPHSFQGNDWVTEPEALAFEFLCFFVHGWEGAFAYYFPRGYDYRHWRAMAEANTLVAAYEDFTFKGKPDNSGVKLTGLTPLPEKLFYPPFWEEPEGETGRAPGLSKMGPLQSQAWRHNGELLVCAGNFWQRGEHFFKLQITRLDPSKKYGVSASGTGCGNFSGAELAAGIVMQAGALRWQFIRIGRPAKEEFSQARMKALMTARLPEIEKAVAREKALYEKMISGRSAENPSVDYGALKSVSNEGVTVSPARRNLTVTTLKYTLTTEPGQGGRLHNWRQGKDELVAASRDFGFAAAGVWFPAKAAFQLRSGMKLEGIVPAAGGVEVRLSRVLTAKDSRKFAGVRFDIVHRFTADGVTTRTKVTNPLENAVEFAFRYHNMPTLLGGKGGDAGEILFASGELFKRDFDQKLIRIGREDQILEKAFSIIRNIRRAERLPVTLRAPRSSSVLELFFPVTPHAIVVWDDSRQAAPTFEPVFERTQLDPGRSAEFVMTAAVKEK